VRCAKLAQKAGYDGVEIMGSEGYLLNQFLYTRTNQRTDRWGGSIENRMRLPMDIVRQVRAAVGQNFILMYRHSVLDLVDGGNSWDEVVAVAQALEVAGVTLFNTGIGWHEARTPTVVTSVPRAAFASVAARLKQAVKVPVIASNRINMPDEVEALIASGSVDMVSMARPFLADADWVNKVAAGKVDEINTCIACNQACLDHTFANKRASCLVNPRAGHETELVYRKTQRRKKIAVVGAGPAGLSAATVAAECGHAVTLFDSADRIGGQFNITMQVPGKEEFAQTLRYFAKRVEATSVDLQLGQRVTREQLLAQGFDEVTGIVPRTPRIPGVERSNVVSYLDVLQRKVVPRASAWPSLAPVALVLMWGSSCCTTRPFPCRYPLTTGAVSGAWTCRPRPMVVWCHPSRRSPTASSTCCNAKPRAWEPASAKPRAGCTAPCCSAMGWRCWPVWSTSASMMPVCTSPSTVYHVCWRLTMWCCVPARNH